MVRNTSSLVRVTFSIVALTAFAIPVASFAADAPAEKPAAAAQTPATRPAAARMTPQALRQAMAKLDLGDDQKQQVKSIMEEFRGKTAALKNETDAAQRGPKMQQTMRDLRDQLMAVLTPEQQVKFKEELKTLMPVGQAGGGNMIDRVLAGASELNLSDDQKTQIKDLGTKYREKFQSVRAQNSGDRTAMREQTMELMQDFRGELNLILTPEQQQKLLEKFPALQKGGAGGANKKANRAASGNAAK